MLHFVKQILPLDKSGFDPFVKQATFVVLIHTNTSNMRYTTSIGHLDLANRHKYSLLTKHIYPNDLNGHTVANTATGSITGDYTRYSIGLNTDFLVADDFVTLPFRKSNCSQYLLQLLQSKSQCHEVLHISSGPARELYELFDEMPDFPVNFTCVESNPQVVAYGRKLLEEHLDHIRFIEQDLFQFDPPGEYDLVWSANLFNYLDDGMFMTMLHRYAACLSDTGEIVVGCSAMEHASNSFFTGSSFHQIGYHRTPDQLLSLAAKAGFDMDKVYVGTTQYCTGVFLHIRL